MDQRPRLLLVDDDKDVLLLMRELLDKAGFDVDTADSGRAAIQKVDASPRPTVMTLDLMMPDIDGWGVLAHLRRIPAPPAVVVVTGHPESVGPFSIMASVAAYIVKPFSSADLVAICRTVAAGRTPRSPEGEDQRREPRRMFVVAAKIVVPGTDAFANGHIVEMSPTGVRVDVDMDIEAGRTIEISFMLPGYKNPIRAKGIVRWRQGRSTGLELIDLDPGQAQRLQDLMKPLGKPPIA
jgi:two-component system KDP operon response regulator KdpE